MSLFCDSALFGFLSLVVNLLIANERVLDQLAVPALYGALGWLILCQASLDAPQIVDLRLDLLRYLPVELELPLLLLRALLLYLLSGFAQFIDTRDLE